MSATRHRPPRQRPTRQPARRRTAESGDQVWVIDLVAAEARRSVQPVAAVARRRWDLRLAGLAAAVWAYDVIAVVLQVRH